MSDARTSWSVISAVSRALGGRTSAAALSLPLLLVPRGRASRWAVLRAGGGEEVRPRDGPVGPWEVEGHAGGGPEAAGLGARRVPLARVGDVVDPRHWWGRLVARKVGVDLAIKGCG
jgi:hypothetical protein